MDEKYVLAVKATVEPSYFKTIVNQYHGFGFKLQRNDDLTGTLEIPKVLYDKLWERNFKSRKSTFDLANTFFLDSKIWQGPKIHDREAQSGQGSPQAATEIQDR